MEQEKVLVTGGAGFIGSHTVDVLVAHGYDVLVVDDLSTGYERNVNPRARLYKLDICSPDLADLFEQERPEYVNHHAAQMNVRRSVADPAFDAQVNVLGSLNLIECAIRTKVKKLVYISSGGAVYGEPEYLPCDEEHPVNPICPYGVSKHTVEHYLNVYSHNYGLDYAVLRYPNVYGPRQDPYGEAGVVAIFTGQMLGDEQVVVNGSGEQERDFVYVEDCAIANLLVLRNSHGQIYNLGTGIGTSVNQILAHLKGIIGYDKEPQHGPAKIGETFRIYLDAGKAGRELNWEPTVSLAEGLKRTVDYFAAEGRE